MPARLSGLMNCRCCPDSSRRGPPQLLVAHALDGAPVAEAAEANSTMPTVSAIGHATNNSTSVKPRPKTRAAKDRWFLSSGMVMTRIDHPATISTVRPRLKMAFGAEIGWPIPDPTLPRPAGRSGPRIVSVSVDNRDQASRRWVSARAAARVRSRSQRWSLWAGGGFQSRGSISGSSLSAMPRNVHDATTGRRIHDRYSSVGDVADGDEEVIGEVEPKASRPTRSATLR